MFVANALGARSFTCHENSICFNYIINILLARRTGRFVRLAVFNHGPAASALQAEYASSPILAPRLQSGFY
jgi:hypothetical protein